MASVTGLTGTASVAGVAARVVTCELNINSLRAIWERLFAASRAQPLSSYECPTVTAESHRRGDRFRVMRVDRDGEVIGLLPLVARTLPVFGWPVIVRCPISERPFTHSRNDNL